ncbi:GIY-YIG nuclease family protein [Maricaulis sp.]|uniref:GIY-YIG nuclease family protein n=1 Tax=Maricaulis sp. TaxID=1486257 RepID=UPI0026204CAB|nr:GIY-YIG nuclease family protein [Maricaulis sp.]
MPRFIRGTSTLRYPYELSPHIEGTTPQNPFCVADRDAENIIAVYMMSSRFDGPIYTGVTKNLVRRVGQHKMGEGARFTTKYSCTSLIWWERHWSLVEANQRERRIKKWPRQWKVNLIEAENPEWRDLWRGLF